jgi:8-oxo-dGTP diphosphatase
MDQNKRFDIARVGVGIMLLKDGKILMGKRHDDPEKADSQLHGEGTWTFPGGKVDFGDTVLSAVKRELLEETGIKLSSAKLFSVTDEIVKDAHFVTVGFYSEDFEGEAQTLEPDEIVEWKWFSFDNLPEKIFKPTDKMIKNFLAKEIYKH